MKFLFCCWILWAVCTGCHSASRDIIPLTKMTRVMWDMIQVDEFATGFVAKDSAKNLKLERMKMYQQVFTLHQVSQKDYYASLKYYTAQPDLFKTMIDSLSARATREQRKTVVPSQVPTTRKTVQ